MSAREDMPWTDEAKKLKDSKYQDSIENKKTRVNVLPDGIDLNLLSRLLMFSNKYEITIQFWPEQTAVYISKDGVELQDYGGSFRFAVGSSVDYLTRISGNT